MGCCLVFLLVGWSPSQHAVCLTSIAVSMFMLRFEKTSHGLLYKG